MSQSIWLFLFTYLMVINTYANDHLGTINFATSGNEAAQPYFLLGVKQLHNFQYDIAKQSFIKAQQSDPDFALAYWGEAMTYNHPLWNEQDKLSAVGALNKLAKNPLERVSKAKTIREKGLIQAVNALYGLGNKQERDEVYETIMRRLYRQFPNDNEIASFYSLALLRAQKAGRQHQSYMQAAGIVDEILDRNPHHPGALHYAIHAFDDPIHAPLGLRAAHQYASVAANSSHALHMPSHIFIALGLWHEVIRANEAAWQAGQGHNPSRIASSYTIHDLHALHWLIYANLQVGLYEHAHQLAKTMESIARKANTPMTKWYYALSRAAYVIETDASETDLTSLDMDGVELSASASQWYVNGLLALRQNHPDLAQLQIDHIQHAILQASKFHSPPAGDLAYFNSVTPSGIQAAKIMLLELQAQRLQRNHQASSMLENYLRRASQLEKRMTFEYGPPMPVKPAQELLAEYHLQHRQYDLAYREFIRTLKRLPNRTRSQQGLYQVSVLLKQNGVSLPPGIKPYFHRLMLHPSSVSRLR